MSITQSELAEWLTDQLEHSVSVETTRELLSCAPNETKRMIVFAPKLCPFTHRSPNSLRHPRISQVVWVDDIANTEASGRGGGRGKVPASVEDGRVGLARWQHMDPALRTVKLQGEKVLYAWETVGLVFDGLLTSSTLAATQRASILAHPDWLAYVRKIFDRLTQTMPAVVPATPSKGRPKSTNPFGGTGHSTVGSGEGGTEEKQMVISQAAYCYFEVKLVNTYFDPSSIMDALDAIDADFLFDSKECNQRPASETQEPASPGAPAPEQPARASNLLPAVSFASFNVSMLELADSWTSTLHVDEYVAFLDDVYSRVFMSDWSEELDTILVHTKKKGTKNALAVHQFNEWAQANASKKRTHFNRYLTAIDAEDLNTGKGEDDEDRSTSSNSHSVNGGSLRGGEPKMGAKGPTSPFGSDGSPLGSGKGPGDSSRRGRTRRGADDDAAARELRRKRREDPGGTSSGTKGRFSGFNLSGFAQGSFEWALEQKLQNKERISPREVRFLMDKRQEARRAREMVQYQAVPGKLVTLTSSTTLVGAVAQLKRQFPAIPPPPISARMPRPPTAPTTRKPRPPTNAELLRERLASATPKLEAAALSRVDTMTSVEGIVRQDSQAVLDWRPSTDLPDSPGVPCPVPDTISVTLPPCFEK